MKVHDGRREAGREVAEEACSCCSLLVGRSDDREKQLKACCSCNHHLSIGRFHGGMVAIVAGHTTAGGLLVQIGEVAVDASTAAGMGGLLMRLEELVGEARLVFGV